MNSVNYKGFKITLSDADTNKLDKAWNGAAKHWTCKIRDITNRKQMSFDVFGGRLATMKPLEALYYFVDDACSFMNVRDVKDVMDEFGYKDYTEAKNIFKLLEKAYYKCRKFIGSDNDIIEIANELREEWG